MHSISMIEGRFTEWEFPRVLHPRTWKRWGMFSCSSRVEKAETAVKTPLKARPRLKAGQHRSPEGLQPHGVRAWPSAITFPALRGQEISSVAGTGIQCGGF